MNITIVGAGYVGFSLSVLLATKYQVTILDIDSKKIDLISKKVSPFKDKDIDNFLNNKNLNLYPTTDSKSAYESANYIIIATPTNYDSKYKKFDTSQVKMVIEDALKYNKKAIIIIKSTVPFGFTDSLKQEFHYDKILFSPEFLRESKSLYDNLFPQRIVVGGTSREAKKFANILVSVTNNKDNVPIFCMQPKEAEAVKLFANTYLAMRVSFFNELDTFSEFYQMSSKDIIGAVSADQRIGDYYNNPSFGYGGYCLPKDTKQLLDNYSKIPNNIIKAVVEANETRKQFIANSILNKKPKVVGVYRLIMKSESENFRESAILDIIKHLNKKKIKLILYEPLLKKTDIKGIKLINDLDKFKIKSDLVIANRITDDLKSIREKVYSRDIYRTD